MYMYSLGQESHLAEDNIGSGNGVLFLDEDKYSSGVGHTESNSEESRKPANSVFDGIVDNTTTEVPPTATKEVFGSQQGEFVFVHIDQSMCVSRTG